MCPPGFTQAIHLRPPAPPFRGAHAEQHVESKGADVSQIGSSKACWLSWGLHLLHSVHTNTSVGQLGVIIAHGTARLIWVVGQIYTSGVGGGLQNWVRSRWQRLASHIVAKKITSPGGKRWFVFLHQSSVPCQWTMQWVKNEQLHMPGSQTFRWKLSAI